MKIDTACYWIAQRTIILLSYLFCISMANIIFESLYSNALRVLCTSKKYLTVATNCVVKDGGEGVILRKPFSQYEKGRSTNLFKFKVCLHHFYIKFITLS